MTDIVNITMVGVKIKTRNKLRKVAKAAGRSMSTQAIKFVEERLENDDDSKILTKDKK